MRLKRRRITKDIREDVLRRYDYKCVNCGCSDELEIHHIVPLEIGGNDITSNMVALCYDCHKAVTNHQLLLTTTGRPHKVGGRKRVFTNCDDILDRYFRCEIGARECKELIGMSPKNHITDNVWYKEYLEKHGIKKFRNNVDIKTANKGIKTGDCVGYIIYKNGTKKHILWNADPVIGTNAKMRNSAYAST